MALEACGSFTWLAPFPNEGIWSLLGVPFWTWKAQSLSDEANLPAGCKALQAVLLEGRTAFEQAAEKAGIFEMYTYHGQSDMGVVGSQRRGFSKRCPPIKGPPVHQAEVDLGIE